MRKAFLSVLRSLSETGRLPVRPRLLSEMVVTPPSFSVESSPHVTPSHDPPHVSALGFDPDEVAAHGWMPTQLKRIVRRRSRASARSPRMAPMGRSRPMDEPR